MSAPANGSHQADLVIVGGGIFGCSIAWHYARLGVGRVLLLERDILACAATSCAAALLTRARVKTALMVLIAQTYSDIAALEAELDETLDLHRVGSLHVAASALHRRELQDLVGVAERAGLRVDWLTADDAIWRVPWLNLEGDAVTAFMPDDGFIDPYRLAMAYARAARRCGAELRQGVAVTGFLRQGDWISGVATTQGPVHAACVVDAAGAWAGLLAASLGVGLPMAPVRSQYWITAPDPLFPPDHPITILPDARAYSRPDLGGLLFGLRERQSVSIDPRRLPCTSSGFALGEAGGHSSLEGGAPALRRFLPALDQLGIAHYIAGLSTYTPDGLPILGAVAGLGGFLAATGCSGAGIATAGGVGASIAALAAERTPPFDLAPFRIDRFGPINPFNMEFRRRCEQARSNKSSG